MADWFVSGPFDVPVYTTQNGARFIDQDDLDALREQCDQFDDEGGLYVFGQRAGRGVLPVCVGMTENNTIIKEAFNPRNVNNINQYINDHAGTLVIYVVSRVKSGGRRNFSDISEIEYFLLGHAQVRNDDLINTRTPNGHAWSIKGVYNSGQGRRTDAEQQFREMMGI